MACAAWSSDMMNTMFGRWTVADSARARMVENMAWSMFPTADFARGHDYPPSISFDSANGPSVMGTCQPRERTRRRRPLVSNRVLDSGATSGWLSAGSVGCGACVSWGNLTVIVRLRPFRKRILGAPPQMEQTPMSSVAHDDYHRADCIVWHMTFVIPFS